MPLDYGACYQPVLQAQPTEIEQVSQHDRKAWCLLASEKETSIGRRRILASKILSCLHEIVWLSAEESLHFHNLQAHTSQQTNYRQKC